MPADGPLPGRAGDRSGARSAPGGALVEVAIDAAGGGGARTYTYAVPAGSPTSSPARPCSSSSGGARRSAVVLGRRARVRRDRATKPVAARVRTDGPLLPPLSLRSPAGSRTTTSRHRRSSSGRCSRRGSSSGSSSSPSVDAGGAARARDRRRGRRVVDLLDSSTRRPAAGRAISSPPRAGPGCSGASARSAARASHAGLDAARAPARGPRYERWLRLTAGRAGRGRGCGRASAAGPAARAAPGRRAGARGSSAARRPPRDGALRRVPAARLAERHGDVGDRRARPARPRRASMSASDRGGRSPAGPRAARRPAGRRDPDRAQAAAVALAREAIAARDPTPLLLDGVTGGGKTAIYVEAIAASLETRPAGARARPGDRARDCRSSTGSAPTWTPASRCSTRAWARASAPTSGGGSAPATSTSSSGRGWPSSRRSPTSA